jgi:hypothetical protein
MILMDAMRNHVIIAAPTNPREAALIGARYA